MLSPSLVRHVIASAVLVAIFVATGPVPANGQVVTPPWPDGCSIGLPLWIQRGVDRIFLGACNNHDRCWAECNGPNPPFNGLGHKASCDAQFLVQLEAACIAIAPTVALPFGDADTVADFIETCAAVGATMYVAVATPLTNNIFWRSQCLRGCNPNGCANSGFPLPFTCGNGQCYITPPPIPPINPCIFVDCNDPICGPIQRSCCPDCTWPPGEC